VDTSTKFYRFFLIAETFQLDRHIIHYVGSLVVDIPGKDPGPPAKGKYSVNPRSAETYLDDGTNDIPTLQENGFIVDIRTGSCCYGLGGAAPDCVNNVLLNECDALPQPAIWRPGAECPAKGGPPCAECTIAGRNTDPLCDDGDGCTEDDCAFPPGICSHVPIAGFNPVKGGPGDTGNCCNPVTKALTDKDHGDVCTRDYCSAADNRGTAVHDAVLAAGDPCDDGNACTTPDLCDGIRSDAAGGCIGRDVNTVECATDAQCPLDPAGVLYPCSTVNPASSKGLYCFCTLTPKVTFVLNENAPGKTCIGGDNDGAPCAKPEDCPRGYCDIFPANCFDEGAKVTALVHISSAGSPINGGQLQIDYDPTCLALNSVSCLFPYTEELYRNVSAGAGKIFIACGVDPFLKVDGPLGNVDMVALNFTKIGQCNNCELCIVSKNPQNSYLVNDGGYKVNIETQCKELSANGDLVLNIPDNIKANSDCDVRAAVVTWDAPTATFSCGDVNLVCRGAHESGLPLEQTVVYNGGLLPQGASSFCCYAWAKDKCEQVFGCPPDRAAANCTGDPKPDGCWTVEVNDETSLDIHIQLEPPVGITGELERCIEFCLYGPCVEGPTCFEENVLFGGLYNYIGKTNGKIKIPKGKWGCITAQDQLHSLRSCATPDCIDGQLKASFKGDPTYDGNWLIMGNLDAWKKANPLEDPSLDVIDILDFGKFVSQFQVCYDDRKYGCHEGPHADINGDGCVDSADYNFILRNFLVSAKDCCCGPTAASLPAPLAEVSVDQLRQMGLDDLVVADLNGDGLVNAEDMDAFSQGARPTKTSNDRKGGKGLRSGR
jgi:hypothetical protein